MKMMIILLATIFSFQALATTVEVEIGETQIHTNFFQIPSTGTRVYFPENRRQSSARVYVDLKFDEKDSIRFLLAPFKADAKVLSGSDIQFMQSTFVAGSPIDVGYQFNSYRASYIRTWIVSEKFSYSFGFTGKIRDASIKLSNGAVSKERANVGFVPLLNAGFQYVMTPNWRLEFDVDAAAASQGRAIDGAVDINYSGYKSYKLGVGYRVLDGGVDTKANVNFAQLRTVFLNWGYFF